MILGGDITSALTSFAGLGLALILEGDGARRVRLGWTDAAKPRMVVTADGYDDEAIAETVHRHAQVATSDDSWIQANLEDEPWNGASAVFSPRIKSATDKDSKKQAPSAEEVANRWHRLQLARWDPAVDENNRSGDMWGWCSSELIGALGEPAYWRFARADQKDPRPDEGASRWEMITRNQGKDFIKSRLRRLADFVADRDVSHVLSGLIGESTCDEAYANKRSDESRTATGLTPPKFTDSALAWCALWGIASFPVIHRLAGASVTVGALPVGRVTPEYLVLPALVGSYSLARWRAILTSAQLVRATTEKTGTARAWLATHGVRALIQFSVFVSSNENARERYLRSGILTVLKR